MSIPPTLFTALLAALETLLNDALKYDQASAEGCRELSGKLIAIEIVPHRQKIYVELGFPLRLSSAPSKEPDATLAATPVQLRQFFEGQGNGSQDIASGNRDLTDKLSAIYQQAEIDWEAKLATFVGDLPAHFTGQRLRELGKWLGHVKNSFWLDAEEYIHFETGVLPSHQEMRQWFLDVDSLQAKSAQLEDRISHLESAVQPKPVSPDPSDPSGEQEQSA